MANLLKSEQVPQSKSKNSPFALAGDMCCHSLPSPPPPKHSHRDTCVWAFCPNSKLNLRFFSFVWYMHSTPECQALQGTLSLCELENLNCCTKHLRQRCCFVSLPTPDPLAYEFLQCRKKTAHQSLLSHLAPTLRPSS